MKRLLPHSRRGTWLLAGTMWCAACAGLWWALPVVTRFEWTVPEHCMPLAFLDGRRALVTWSYAIKDGNLSGLGPVRLWDANTGGVTLIGGHEHNLSAGDVSKSGQWIALSQVGADAAIQVYDSRTEEPVCNLPRAVPASIVTDVAFSPDERSLAIAERVGEECHIYVREIISKKEVFSGQIPVVKDPNLHVFGYKLLNWSPDGQILAMGESDGRGVPGTPKIRFWRLDSGKLFRTFDGPERSQFADMKFSPDSRYFSAAYSTPNRPVFETRCWNVENGSELSRSVGDVAHIQPQGPWMIDWGRGAAPKRIRVFGFDDSTPQIEFQLGPDEGVVSGGLAFDHRTLALSMRGSDRLTDWLLAHGWSVPWSQGEYWHARFVDGPTRREIGRLTPVRMPKVDSGATWAEFSPDGRLFAVNDGQIFRVYDFPPRKSLTWFAAGAALLALPIALVAQRRSRKLRAA